MNDHTTDPRPAGETAEILALLAAADVSVDQLRGLLTTASPVLLSAHVTTALAELKRQSPGSHRTWAPYLLMLADGLPDVCPCPCPVCATGECPCPVGEHAADCAPPTGEDLDCSARYPGSGGKAAGAVVRSDIEDLTWWAQRKALKRTVARNVKRAQAGDPLHVTDGRGAAEAAIQGTRWLFTWLIDNDLAEKNPARAVKIPTRQERPARSLEVGELLEVYRTAVTTGRDPQLDALLLRHQLIHAVRRGGLLSAHAGGVDATALNVTYWDPKRKTHRTRPSTRAHIAHLVAHMLERGPRVPASPDAPDWARRAGVPSIADTDPVFYRRPVDTFDEHGYLVHRQVRPVTAKHVETLFTRIKRHLPWARRRGLRPHDLRHTSARLVYQAADQQMARLHLAHDAGNTTDHYLAEQHEALRRLKEALFGDEPPTERPGPTT